MEFIPDRPEAYKGMHSASPVDRRRIAALIPYWENLGIRASKYELNRSDAALIYFATAHNAVTKIEQTLTSRFNGAVVLGITEDVLTSDWAGNSKILTDLNEIVDAHYNPQRSIKNYLKKAVERIGLPVTDKIRLLRVIAKADMVICASEAQAASLRHINPFCVAIAEAIPDEDFRPISSEFSIQLLHQKREEGSVLIAWEGTAWGLGLLEQIRPQLERLHAHTSTPIRLVVAMPNRRPSPLFGMTDNAQIVKTRYDLPVTFVSWLPGTIGGVLHACDIGIAPMPYQNPYYAAKAHNKPAVYMNLGLPVVASNILAYRALIKHGFDGFIAKRPEDWFEYIHLLANNPNLRNAMGRQAKLKFDAECSTEMVAFAFAEAFRQALEVRQVRVSRPTRLLTSI